MAEIPKSVKINGKRVTVKESPRGYVRVGKTTLEMGPELKEYCNSVEGEEHVRRWQAYMLVTFKNAVIMERRRVRRS